MHAPLQLPVEVFGLILLFCKTDEMLKWAFPLSLKWAWQNTLHRGMEQYNFIMSFFIKVFYDIFSFHLNSLWGKLWILFSLIKVSSL